jgi:hypothetical protein
LVTDREAHFLVRHAAKAFVAHSMGNENPDLKLIFDSSQLSLWGRFIFARQKNMIDNLWSNLPPADLNITLDLKAR